MSFVGVYTSSAYSCRLSRGRALPDNDKNYKVGSDILFDKMKTRTTKKRKTKSKQGKTKTNGKDQMTPPPPPPPPTPVYSEIIKLQMLFFRQLCRHTSILSKRIKSLKEPPTHPPPRLIIN